MSIRCGRAIASRSRKAVVSAMSRWHVLVLALIVATALAPATATYGQNHQQAYNTVDLTSEWYTLAANPQRTSWVSEEVRGNLSVEWYRPIEPYIPYKIQPIAANGKLYVSSSRGLYAINAATGDVAWVYPTEVPLGHSPTVTAVNGRLVAYVGGYDRKIHAIDAATGTAVSGYAPYEAGAGFETNPLVVDNVIYAGNRDGYFYALDAITGALKWRYQTGGPIRISAAYKNGTVYFASVDMYAYALNAGDGSLVWKSAKMPGQGFYSFWPVVYTNRATGKDYVVFDSGENYRFQDLSLSDSSRPEPDAPAGETYQLFRNVPTGNLIGPTSTVVGDWTPGTVTIDIGAVTSYLQNYPFRRQVFILDAGSGREFTFDSNGDGRPEYAPFVFSGMTHSGSKYPPVINGVDGVYYQDTAYYSGGWVSRGHEVGWKFGTKYVSLVSDADNGTGNASDEPRAFSSGGKLIYWSLCCDREAGAFDITIPFGQLDRGWQYWGYSLGSLAPDYQMMYNDGNPDVYYDINGFQEYSGMGNGQNHSKNGVYGKHGTVQSPPIPYQGRVYVLKGNALIAFSPTASPPARLPLATTVVNYDRPPSMEATDVQGRLEVEIQKMLNAGHLRPGYSPTGIPDQNGVGWYDDNREFGEISDYFQNPSDTVVTLLQTLPYLSPALQSQVKSYLQVNYGPGAPYDISQVVHIGWNTGAAREWSNIPPDAWSGTRTEYSTFDARTTPVCGSCGYWQYFDPFNFYAAWKYAEVFGDAKSLFDTMGGKLELAPSDTYLLQKPYYLNRYAAGYLGFLELQKLAGSPQSAGVLQAYNHVLNLRTDYFSKDNPYFGLAGSNPGEEPNRILGVARNFMFLTPEIADYMSQRIQPQVRTAIFEYNNVAAYWFVSAFDDTFNEGSIHMLYDYPALFQAKAYILKQPYHELAKWLDVPAFQRGDLFYIQNLVATLQAPQQGSVYSIFIPDVRK